MGAFPEELILESLFTLFLKNMDEKEVRELFAEFGPKSPRMEGRQRELYLLQLYLRSGQLRDGLPKKAPFAQKIANYNAKVPREKQLGSRSTSQANILRYLERALNTHRGRVKFYIDCARGMPAHFRSGVPAPEMPIKTNPGRHFRRKMSRQT